MDVLSCHDSRLADEVIWRAVTKAIGESKALWVLGVLKVCVCVG